MSNKEKNAKAHYIVLAVLSVLLIASGLVLLVKNSNKQIVSQGIQSWSSEYCDYNNEFSLDADETDYNFEEGRLDFVRGPYISLNKGFYNATVEYECVADQFVYLYAPYNENNIVIFKENGSILPASKTKQDVKFALKSDVDNFEFRVQFDGNGYMKVRNITISTDYSFLIQIWKGFVLLVVTYLIGILARFNVVTGKNIFLYGIIFVGLCIAVFLRVYGLFDIPMGWHIDESAISYDAWSIANFGVDRNLDSYPVYFTNYGGGQSAMLTYLIALAIKLTGGSISIVATRIPAVVINVIAYVFGVLLIKECMNLRWAAFASILLAISPYFIMNCRFATDCNLMINMLIISSYCLLLALSKRRIYLFVITGVLWGLTYYNYAVSYIPNTFILIVVCVYAFIRNRISLKELIALWVPVVCLGAPLLLMLIINQFDLPEMKLGCITVTKLYNFRGSEFGVDLKMILNNVGVVLSSILAKDWLPYNAPEKYYTFYLVSVPFFFFGLIKYSVYTVKMIRNKDISFDMFPGAVFIFYFVLGIMLGGDGPNTNIMNGIMFSVFYIIIWGVREAYREIKMHQKAIVTTTFAVVLSFVYLINLVGFSNYYYSEKAFDRNIFFGDNFGNMISYLEENDLCDRTVYVDAPTQHAYIYYLISKCPNPFEFNLPKDRNESTYLNYDFRTINNFCDEEEEVEFDDDSVYIVLNSNDYMKEYLYEENIPLIIPDRMFSCYYLGE